MVKVELPDPYEVGLLYDRFTDLGDATLGDNLHFGYWEDPDVIDPEDTLQAATHRFTDQMIERMHIVEGMRVLDVGCGVGGPAIRLANATGAEVLGITVSAEQVKRATALAEAQGLSGQVGFQRADVLDLPFPAESFDAVWALESLCHVPDRPTALKNIARVLRPGGRLVVTDFFQRGPIRPEKKPAVDGYFRDFMMSPMVTAEGYPRLFQEAGLLFHEQLDISEQTLPRTFTLMSERIQREKLDFEGRFGEEMVGQYDPGDLLGIWELGYLVAVAKRETVTG